MSSVHQENDTQILEQIAGIDDISQFVQGVQSDPAVILNAIKALAHKNEKTGVELRNARRKIKKLEENQSAEGSSPKLSMDENLMTRFVEALEMRNTGKSAPVPDTHIFSGLKKDFHNWKESIMMKMNGNQDHYPTEQSRMIYAYSRMNTDSKTHLDTWVRDGVILFSSFAQMMHQLTVIFGDPNRVRDAVSRLHSNAQRNKPFSTWIAEIRRDAAIAGYESNSQHLRDLVLSNMSLELKRALIYERDIDYLSFDEAVSRLQDIDNRQRAYAVAESRFRTRNDNLNISTRQSSRTFPTSQMPTQPPPPPAPQPPADPMDLSASSFHRRGPLTQQEKDYRRSQRLCLYCGESGHMIRDCVRRNQKYPVLGRAVGFESPVEATSESGNA